MSKKLILYVIIIILVSISLIGCKKSSDEMKDDEGKIIPVVVTSPIRKDMEEIVGVNGTVHPIEESYVSPKISGEIVEIFVDEGDVVNVKSEKPIAKLDDEQFKLDVERAELNLKVSKESLAERKANLTVREAELEKAKADWERMEKLHKRGSIPKQRYDHAKANYETAQARLKQAKTAVKLSNLQIKNANVGLKLAKKRLNDTKIFSPISGVISKRFMNTGEMGTPGKPIFYIVNNKIIEVKADVPSQIVRKIELNKTCVQICADELNSEIIKNKVRKLRPMITEISPIVDKKTRTVEITIRIDNDPLIFKPGMFIRLKIILARHPNTIVVPKVALVKKDSEYLIFKVESEKAQRKKVKIGIKEGRFIEILNDAVNEKDEIIIEGHNNLAGGERIRIVKDKSHRADPKTER